MSRRVPNRAYIKAARTLYENDDVEIDDQVLGRPCALSRSGYGAWVQAWVYVHNEDVTPKKKED